jgi:hypothetical protein
MASTVLVVTAIPIKVGTLLILAGNLINVRLPPY